MMKQPDSMQHRVTRVRAQTPDPVLNIVINCMKNPIKILKKKKIHNKNASKKYYIKMCKKKSIIKNRAIKN